MTKAFARGAFCSLAVLWDFFSAGVCDLQCMATFSVASALLVLAQARIFRGALRAQVKVWGWRSSPKFGQYSLPAHARAECLGPRAQMLAVTEDRIS